jgi:DNA-binding transcriptional ArsR family regulator
MTDENVVVVEQGSLEAQRIAKAMSSPTSADLFNALSAAPMSATALAEQSRLPLTTVKYHLENMLSADLIEVSDTRWSVKGRAVKIYAVKDQVVLLAPRKHMNIPGILERYGTAAGCLAVLSALALAIPETLLGYSGGTEIPQGLKAVRIEAETVPAVNTFSADFASGVPGTAIPAWLHEGILIFLIAGLFVLAVMMIYEIYAVRRDAV